MTSTDNHPSQHAQQADFSPLGNGGVTSAASSGRTVDIVRLTLEHWQKLVAGVLLGLLAGILVYLYSGPRYVGTTRLLVTKPPEAQLLEGGANTDGDTGGHAHLIKSHVIVGRAFQLHDLGRLPTLRRSDDPVKDIIDGLDVKRSVGQDRSFQSILDLKYTSPSQSDAGIIASAIIDAYGEYLTRDRQEYTQEVLDLFTGADAKLQQEIAKLEQEYQSFRNDAPILFTSPFGRETATGLAVGPPNHYLQEVDRIRTNLSATRNRRTDVMAQQKVIQEMIDNGESGEAIEHYVMLALSRSSVSAGGEGAGGAGGGAGALLTGPPAKERLDAELLRQRLEEARLAHHIGPRHPAAVKTRKAIDVILDAYRTRGLTPPKIRADAAGNLAEEDGPGRVDIPSVYMKFLQTQLQQLTYAEEVMAEELERAIADARDASIYEVRDKQLADELQRKKILYDELVQRREKVDLTKQQTGIRMQPISDVLVELSVKHIIKMLGAFAIFGGTCVFAILCFLEWQDLSIRSLGEVRQDANATVIGTIPRFHVDPETESQDGSGFSSALSYYYRPLSREAEAFRSIRTTLFFNTSSQDRCVIQVSSPEPGDGKTTSAANLAMAVAQSGKRVLLIDGDLRRPTMHQHFGLPAHVGLSDVLRRDVDWINAVRGTIIDGLSVMTAGDPPPNPAELLSTPAFTRMLASARQEYDYVFIDTPPVLAVSDPCIISPHTDGLLLVVRMNKNQRPAVVRARDILNAHGVHVYGVIANDLEPGSCEDQLYHDYSADYDTGTSATSVVTPSGTGDDAALV